MELLFLIIFIGIVLFIYNILYGLLEGTLRRKKYQEFIDMFFKEYELRESIRNKYRDE